MADIDLLERRIEELEHRVYDKNDLLNRVLVLEETIGIEKGDGPPARNRLDRLEELEDRISDLEDKIGGKRGMESRLRALERTVERWQ